MSAASEFVRLLVLMMRPRDSMISVLISRISSSASRMELPVMDYCGTQAHGVCRAGLTHCSEPPKERLHHRATMVLRQLRRPVLACALIAAGAGLGSGCGGDRYILIGSAQAPS